MRLRRGGLIALVSMYLAGASTTARAEWPGLRLSARLVLHLAQGAEVRYDSNLFFADGTTNPTIGGAILRILPSIDLATRPPQRGGDLPHLIDFRLHAGVDYREFLTGDTAINSHRSVAVEAGGLLT